jgi:hypothetical protein
MALKILPWVKNSAPFIFGFGAVSFLLFGFIALKIWTIRIRNSCILFSYLVRYLFCFYWLVGGASQVQPFIFCNESIWLAHCKKKKLKLWRLSKNGRFYG